VPSRAWPAADITRSTGARHNSYYAECLTAVFGVLPDDFRCLRDHAFAFHPDNRQLVIAMQGALYQRNALIGLYDIEQGEAIALIEDTTFRGLGYRARDLQFSADGALLVSTADHDGFVVWDIVQHEYLFGGTPAGMLIITPDNHYLIILTGSVAHIWDIQQRREVDRRQFSCAARIVMDGRQSSAPSPQIALSRRSL
jgi:hypothetical protein